MSAKFENSQTLSKKRLYIRKALWITPFFNGTGKNHGNEGAEEGMYWNLGTVKCDLCKEEITGLEINLLVLDGKVLATLCDECHEKYRDVFER